jgi:hypothetical protein
MGTDQRTRIGELPKALLDESAVAIKNYSVALIHRDDLIGSGTLATVGDRHGILTAHHVVYNGSRSFDFTPGHDDVLGVGITDAPHAFEIPMAYLKPHHTGTRKSAAYGPDLCFIEIPEVEHLGTLKAKKSFWPLDGDRQDKVEQAERDEGVWAISYFPYEMRKDEAPSAGFDKVLGFQGFAGFTGVDTREEQGGFDYYEVTVVYDGPGPIPQTFGGASGGGLWRIPLRRDSPSQPIVAEWPILAGVIFCETPLANQRRRLRCHGPRSVYQELWERIQAD